MYQSLVCPCTISVKKREKKVVKSIQNTHKKGRVIGVLVNIDVDLLIRAMRSQRPLAGTGTASNRHHCSQIAFG